MRIRVYRIRLHNTYVTILTQIELRLTTLIYILIYLAVCLPVCSNGGTCSGPGTCLCDSGWTESDCTTRT
jgi:hypothetical protein